MAWAMSSRVLGLPDPEAGPLDGPSRCPVTEREICTGIVRGWPEEGPPACSGPGAGSGRGNPEGLERIPVRSLCSYPTLRNIL